ncbi:MAG: AAA family ATPase [Bacteroidales bacterium]|nr:AAA family ATPase [Bacteroidales bacterium]
MELINGGNMTSRLKNLYKYLIDNRKHELESWHNAFKSFYHEVEEIRIRINEKRDLTSADQDFLKKLLFDKNNGISSRGQSVLSRDNFQSFINDDDFLSPLKEFIIDPSAENFGILEKAWIDQGKTRNPVLLNRVAAACTTYVSTTVDSGKFNQVFSWLIGEGIVPEYPADNQQDWFAKNLYLMDIILRDFKDELRTEKTDRFYLSLFVWELYVNLSNPFSLKKQIVKYGSPGTGKTYQARQQTSLLFDIWKEEFAPDRDFVHESLIQLVQFHPSYSYEDFMEGLRPVIESDRSVHLKLQNGIFKEFCKNAGKWEIDYFNLGLTRDWESITIKELLPYEKQLSGTHWRHIFEISDTSKLVSDAVPPFFFIIDEINRAELSRVFGELMFSLEYRGTRGCIATQYANLNNDRTGMIQTDQGYLFFIPVNIYLIGTMNTIDRSVESFDFALRRRFRWEEVAPDTELLRYHLIRFCKRWVSLADNLDQLNSRIEKEPLLGHDYQIGHAYFMNLKYSTDLTISEVRERIWDDSILPLLQEYLRGTGKDVELLNAFAKSFGI